MTAEKCENVIGAFALALADEILASTEDEAPEPGSAAAALALIGHEPGITIERLRRALGLSHPGAVRLVDRLETPGLVERGHSHQDRRTVSLALTDTGRQRVDAVLSRRQSVLQAALSTLSHEERTAFAQTAEKLLCFMLKDLDHAYTICRLCDQDACIECPVDAELNARLNKRSRF